MESSLLSFLLLFCDEDRPDFRQGIGDAERKYGGLPLLFSARCETRIFRATLHIMPGDNNDNDSAGISKVSYRNDSARAISAPTRVGDIVNQRCVVILSRINRKIPRKKERERERQTNRLVRFDGSASAHADY